MPPKPSTVISRPSKTEGRATARSSSVKRLAACVPWSRGTIVAITTVATTPIAATAQKVARQP